MASWALAEAGAFFCGPRRLGRVRARRAASRVRRAAWRAFLEEVKTGELPLRGGDEVAEQLPILKVSIPSARCRVVLFSY